MNSLRCSVTDRWRKNWPEVRCAFAGGLPTFIFETKPSRLFGIPVFCYHVVDWDSFESDLTFLRENDYQTATADQLLAHLSGVASLNERHVVLSFDDGARNLHDVVLPLLRRFEFRAVAFICPALHRDDEPDVSLRPCTWPELMTIHESGVVDIQSHTLEHRSALRWPEPVALTGCGDTTDRLGDAGMTFSEDVHAARVMLERRLGKRVQHLAFPQYDATPEAVAGARFVGYRGLWHGVLPGRAANARGDSPEAIVRVSGEFVQRLPGRQRRPLFQILQHRYGRSIRNWWPVRRKSVEVST